MNILDLQKQRNKYCKTKNPSELKEYFTSVHKSVNIPYTSILQLGREFNYKYLDNTKYTIEKNIKWVSIDYYYSNYTEHDLDHLYKNACTELDITWFDKQNHYIKGLSKEDFLTISSYSYNSYNIINGMYNNDKEWWEKLQDVIKYMEKNKYFPFFYQAVEMISQFPFSITQKKTINYFKNSSALSELYLKFIDVKKELMNDVWKMFWKEVLIEYSRDLDRIIKNAPKTSSCVTVWRGTNTSYWLNSIYNDKYLFPSFTSTSLELRVADKFRDEEGECCLMRIIIPKGSSCLFVGSLSAFSESEILFGKNAIFKQDNIITHNIQNMKYKQDTGDVDKDLCGEFEEVQMSFLIFDGYE